jgi:ankyrin repeat protein
MEEPLEKKVNQSANFDEQNLLQLFKSKNIDNIKVYLNSLVDIKKNEYNILSLFIQEYLIFNEDQVSEIFNILLDLNINFNITNQNGYTVLKVCVINKFIKLAELLIKSRKINLDEDLVYLIIRKNLLSICKLFLEYGTNSNTQNCLDVCLPVGSTPLIAACYYNNIEMVNILLEYKANPCITNEHKKYPLIYSCDLLNTIGNYNYEIINLLIKNGSPINTPDHYNLTPLLYACGNINEKSHLLITTLLEAGADPTFEDGKGNDSLLTLVINNIECRYYMLVPIMITLIKYGANKHHKNKYNESIYNLMDEGLLSLFQMCINYTNTTVNNKIFLSKSCLICIDEKDQMVLFDTCKHAVVCFECYQNLMKNTSDTEGAQTKCPYCSTYVSTHTIIENL